MDSSGVEKAQQWLLSLGDWSPLFSSLKASVLLQFHTHRKDGNNPEGFLSLNSTLAIRGCLIRFFPYKCHDFPITELCSQGYS